MKGKIYINEKKGLDCVELQDGTRLILSNGKKITKGATISFPRDKFWPIFEKQMHVNNKWISITFSVEELEFLTEGLEKITKIKNKKVYIKQ